MNTSTTKMCSKLIFHLSKKPSNEGVLQQTDVNKITNNKILKTKKL